MAKGNRSKAVERKISRVVDQLLDELDMRDWKIDIYYLPGQSDDSVAEVTYSIHKEADVRVYDYRPKYIRNDLRHELLHCKVGLASRVYEELFEQQQEVISRLADRYQEIVVDDLERMVDKYSRHGRKK